MGQLDDDVGINLGVRTALALTKLEHVRSHQDLVEIGAHIAGDNRLSGRVELAMLWV